ncbi:MAG: hypothetical protein AB1695_06695 [Stygiobacter sp.]|uniref:Uncharacterized protein n=1 Tax=Stygiobacter electus TaxID=3032292 RepID=A0AAE3P0Z6_9BACT|nr:hypothetical protein [Stygiobacter electus]MDF1612389.1 hypothetical protein [Stygiobacter electus]
MDFAKQYIIQCIVTAANNLRLSSEKIETVAIIKERLNDSNDLLEEIKNFKKITELSKLGIKIHEIYNFLDNGKIDFLKLSDKFKEHALSLVRELNLSLDVLTPVNIREVFKRFEPKISNQDAQEFEIKGTYTQIDEIVDVPKRSKADEIKEALIMDDIENSEKLSFDSYQETIIKPIKEIDSFLNRVLKFNFTDGEMNSIIKTIKENGSLSRKMNFEMISDMHTILAKGLELINQKKLAPSINVIESLRACLIVIVALVKNKEVDITNYLTRAENFGKSILSKQKGF